MRQSKESSVEEMTWQEFEEEVKEIFERHGYKTRFRVIFKDEERGEVDVIAENFGIILAIDAKRYTKKWYRTPALKKQSEKHAKRCKRYERQVGKKVIPIIVSLLDDRIIFYGGCIIVPFESLNDFLLNLHFYLTEFGFI
jgi:Holliday junction resolvase-like predicted endonuclease